MLANSAYMHLKQFRELISLLLLSSWSSLHILLLTLNLGGGDLTLPPEEACSIDFCFILQVLLKTSLTFACETKICFSSAATLADRNKERVSGHMMVCTLVQEVNINCRSQGIIINDHITRHHGKLH